jgi:hypothetical protein
VSRATTTQPASRSRAASLVPVRHVGWERLGKRGYDSVSWLSPSKPKVVTLSERAPLGLRAYYTGPSDLGRPIPSPLEQTARTRGSGDDAETRVCDCFGREASALNGRACGGTAVCRELAAEVEEVTQ